MAIDFALSDGVAVVTINRPERLNAMDAEHYSALSQAWTKVRDNPDIRVAVVTGAGEKSFTVGADLKSFLTAPPGLAEMWLTQRDQLLNRGLEVWKPVIAAINGYCLGGGMTLLLGTDIRVAAEHATFGLSEVKRGVIAGNGGTQRIIKQLPHAIAMELLLTGDSFDAATALALGPRQPRRPRPPNSCLPRWTSPGASRPTPRSRFRRPRSWRCAAAISTSPLACVSNR